MLYLGIPWKEHKQLGYYCTDENSPGVETSDEMTK